LITCIFGIALSGGIHRIAQSRWDEWSFGDATALNLYFMLDNGVASTGTMYVTVPAGVTVTGCAFWALGDTLDPPATMDSWGYWSSGECSLSSALSANTAYGM